MLSRSIITIDEFVGHLHEVLNQRIWKVIHPADGWLHIYLGKRYFEESQEKSEYTIIITGDWEIFDDNTLVATRKVGENETKESYFTRMDKLVNDFPFTSFSTITLHGQDILMSDELNHKLRIKRNRNGEYLSLRKVTLNEKDEPTSYHNVRLDEDTRETTHFISRVESPGL